MECLEIKTQGNMNILRCFLSLLLFNELVNNLFSKLAALRTLCVFGEQWSHFNSYLIFIENILHAVQSIICNDKSFHVQGVWQ